MSDSMRAFAEEMKQYGIEEDVEKGQLTEKQRTVKKLYAKHYSVEEIADISEVDIEQVENWLGLVRA